MKLIVGLGNPGAQYEKTLHNAGFFALDLWVQKQGLGAWSSKFKGLLVAGRLGTQGYALLKPQTYMNLSGESVRAALDFYKLSPADILVLSDDMDLPLGQLRFRQKGGHGGHNGLRNIILHLGGEDFPRLKIGVGRPQGSKGVTAHVLGTPKADDQITLEQACMDCGQHISDFITGNPIQIRPKE